MMKWGKVEVSGGFLLIMAALFYFDTENLLPWALAACALHELGHYATVRLLGGDILRFRLTAVGGEMTLNRAKMLSYGRELCSLLAGPGANFLVAVVSARCFGGEAGWLFAGLNLALGCFNLLPVYPLDGGRALLLVLTGLFSEGVAERVTHICAAVFAVILLVGGGVLLLRTGRNFTLFSMAIWLLAGLLKRRRQARG